MYAIESAPHSSQLAWTNFNRKHFLLTTRSWEAWLIYHARTTILFTIADMKTIFVPISVFACATGPLHSTSRLIVGWSWIWLHQFMCNVSNQSRGRAEDAENKPWRPLPSGRVSQEQAIIIRWVSVALCLVYSTLYGSDIIWATIGLIFMTLAYDELGLSGHYTGKNVCNIGGYTTFEIGATKLMNSNGELDRISITAICISGAVIFTTIQAQDFADIVGDKKLGRITFPIYAPELSRVATLAGLTVWSMFLSYYWNIGPMCTVIFTLLGVVTGLRFYCWRTMSADSRSYIIYNAWLVLVHILPIHARAGVLGF